RSRRMRALPAEAFGVVVRVAARDDGADACREVVEDGATRLEQPEAGEHPARGVAGPVPAEGDAPVTQARPGAGTRSGDEAVDGDGQCGEDLAHGAGVLPESLHGPLVTPAYLVPVVSVTTPLWMLGRSTFGGLNESRTSCTGRTSLS